jgi:putative phosphoesterase
MKLGFLSDAHGNVLAFMQAIEILKEQKAEKIYFLGDAIGYFDSPEVVYYLHDNKIDSIKGNHEEMVINQSVPIAKEQFYRLKQHYDSNLVPIISTWPSSMNVNVGKVLHLVHGSSNDPIWGYTHEDSSVDLNVDWDILICGATHKPFVRNLDGKMIVNIGSCGFPRDKGTNGSCGIYDSSSHEFNIIRFDISESIDHINSTHHSLMPAVKAVWER